MHSELNPSFLKVPNRNQTEIKKKLFRTYLHLTRPGVLFTIVRRMYATAYSVRRFAYQRYELFTKLGVPHSLRRTYDIWRKLLI